MIHERTSYDKLSVVGSLLLVKVERHKNIIKNNDLKILIINRLSLIFKAYFPLDSLLQILRYRCMG